MASLIDGKHGKTLVHSGFRHHKNKETVNAIYWLSWRKACGASLKTNHFDVNEEAPVIQVLHPVSDDNFPPLMWNVYNRDSDTRTNNYVEAFHSGWNQTVGVRHPSLWTFLRHQKDSQAKLELQADAADRGDPRPPRKRKWRQLESRIRLLKRQYALGNRTLTEYGRLWPTAQPILSNRVYHKVLRITNWKTVGHQYDKYKIVFIVLRTKWSTERPVCTVAKFSVRVFVPNDLFFVQS